MKTYFRRTICQKCNSSHDPIEDKCPRCGEPNPEFTDYDPFKFHLRDTIPWQILYFVIGWLGFQLLGITIQIIIQAGFGISHPEATKEELVAFMNTVGVNFAITGIAYLLLFGAFILVLCLRKRIHGLLKTFTNWLPYVVGIGGGIALLGVSLTYGLLADALMKLANIVPSVNENESAVRAMVQGFPVLSIFLFGIIGPFCEEITYRVGLFGFTSRLGKILAYIISSLIFAFIHFGWTTLFGGTRDDILIELINIPSYIIAGLGLALLYDRCGFCASFLAHVTNNMVSVISNLIVGGGA